MKFQDLYEMSGLEPENESDDDENSSEPIPTVLVVKKVEMRGRTNLRSEIREKKSPSKSSSAPKTRSLKVNSICMLQVISYAIYYICSEDRIGIRLGLIWWF